MLKNSMRKYYYSQKAETALQKVFAAYGDKYEPMKVKIKGKWRTFMFSVPVNGNTDGLLQASIAWDDLECLGQAIANSDNIRIDKIERID